MPTQEKIEENFFNIFQKWLPIMTLWNALLDDGIVDFVWVLNWNKRESIKTNDLSLQYQTSQENYKVYPDWTLVKEKIIFVLLLTIFNVSNKFWLFITLIWLRV